MKNYTGKESNQFLNNLTSGDDSSRGYKYR